MYISWRTLSLVSLDQAMDKINTVSTSQLGVTDLWPKPMSLTKRPKPSAQAHGLRATR